MGQNGVWNITTQSWGIKLLLRCQPRVVKREEHSRAMQHGERYRCPRRPLISRLGRVGARPTRVLSPSRTVLGKSRGGSGLLPASSAQPQSPEHRAALGASSLHACSIAAGRTQGQEPGGREPQGPWALSAAGTKPSDPPEQAAERGPGEAPGEDQRPE